MDIHKIFKQFQLGNSVFRGQSRIDNELLERDKIPRDVIEKELLRQLTHQLADKVLSEHSQSITKTKDEIYEQFNIELLIINKGQFKDVVEAAISLTTMEQIEKIRKS